MIPWCSEISRKTMSMAMADVGQEMCDGNVMGRAPTGTDATNSARDKANGMVRAKTAYG